MVVVWEQVRCPSGIRQTTVVEGDGTVDEERKKRLLRKVGKLLAQADGTTYAHEAESAMLMAQKILCDHGMTMAEVDALSVEEQKKLVDNSELVSMGHRHSEWLISLARVIAKAFRCKFYINHRWSQPPQHFIRIVGLADDVGICRDVYSYARETGERLAKDYAGGPGVVEAHLYQRDPWRWFSEWSAAQKAAANREIQAIWRQGFIAGLASKFREQVRLSESMSLMLVIHPVVTDAYTNLGLGTSTYRPRSNDARNEQAQRAGFLAGKQFEAQCPERIAAPLPRLGAGR